MLVYAQRVSEALQEKCDVTSQAAVGETWILVDMSVLAAMLICLITYSVYIRTLIGFQPQDTYEVYDSLGASQARLLLPKKQDATAYNGESAHRHSIRGEECKHRHENPACGFCGTACNHTSAAENSCIGAESAGCCMLSRCQQQHTDQCYVPDTLSSAHCQARVLQRATGLFPCLDGTLACLQLPA